MFSEYALTDPVLMVIIIKMAFASRVTNLVAPVQLSQHV